MLVLSTTAWKAGLTVNHSPRASRWRPLALPQKHSQQQNQERSQKQLGLAHG